MTSLSSPINFTTQLENLQAALKYAELGWHVLPLNGKAPHRLTPHGQKDATTNPSIITDWFTQAPDANIGISLKPSGLVVIDVDIIKYHVDGTTSPKKGEEVFAALEAQYGKITSDVEAITGSGGQHLVFSVSPEKLAQVGGKLVGSLGKDIDLKHNGYIVVAPSMHLSGNKYQWIENKNPLLGAIPELLPDWVYGFKKSDLTRDMTYLPDAAFALTNATDEDMKRAEAALCFIPADDYHEWLQILMALHSTGHMRAFDIANEWSKTSLKYKEGEVWQKWASFTERKEGVTLSTLFHSFQEHAVTEYAQGVAWNIVNKAISDYSKERDYLPNPVSLSTTKVMLAMLTLERAGTYHWGEACAKIKNLAPKLPITDYKKALKDSGLMSLFANRMSNKKESETSRLLRLATEQCECVRDTSKVAYAIMLVNGVRQCWAIKSTDFHEWLSHSYYKENNIAPSANAMKQALETLVGKAKFEGREIAVRIRTAKHPTEEAYYVDLCNDKWQVMEVSAEGVRMMESADVPVYFTRNANMRPLPIPYSSDISGKRLNALSLLWEFVNIPKVDRGMVLTWMLECLRPDTPYTILEISGEQGSAKSSTQTKLRGLIDPNRADLRAAPNNKQDIFVSANSSLLVSYENLSYLSPDMQDTLCSLATGVGYSTRTLYTNSDETTMQLKTPVILNGIAVVVTAQDLLDRTIHIDAPRLSQYIAEAELNERWDKVYPSLFAGLLELFSKTLAQLPNARDALSNERLPRMADFALLGAAMYLAQSKLPKEFLHEYMARRTEGVQRTLDGDPTGAAMLAYLEVNPRGYTGTVQGLLDGLRSFQYVAGGSMPKSARALGDKIRRLSPAMAQVGVVLESSNRRINGRYPCCLRYADPKGSGV